MRLCLRTKVTSAERATLKSVIVFRYGLLGDHLVALPAYWSVRDALPNARLTLLSEQTHHASHVAPNQVLPVTGLFDTYANFPAGQHRRSFVDIAKLWWSLRGRGFQALIYLAPRAREEPKSARRDVVFFRACGIETILGGVSADVLPTHTRRTGEAPLYNVKRDSVELVERLEASGIPRTSRRDDWLALTEQERAHGAAWLLRNGFEPLSRRQLIAIGIGGKWSSKKFPPERLLGVVARLMAVRDVVPVVFGGREDHDLATTLCKQWGCGLIAAGELSVRESAAVMEGMACYLGNDSGTMHLAAAVGLKCVTMFSSIDWPGKWEPVGIEHVSLRSKPPCEGCRLPNCPFDNQCLRDIPDDLIIAGVLSVVSP